MGWLGRASAWQKNLVCSSQAEPLHFKDSLSGKLGATALVFIPLHSACSFGNDVQDNIRDQYLHISGQRILCWGMEASGGCPVHPCEFSSVPPFCPWDLIVNTHQYLACQLMSLPSFAMPALVQHSNHCTTRLNL